MAGRPPDFDEETKGAFVAALERLGSIRAAAAACGVAERTVHRHKQQDEDFADACARAQGRLAGKLLGVARDLAIEGVLEQVYDKDGNLVRERRRYSERVLLRWLARLMPDDWSDTIKVDKTVSGRVEHEHSGAIKVEDMTTEQRRLVRRLLTEDPARN